MHTHIYPLPFDPPSCPSHFLPALYPIVHVVPLPSRVPELGGVRVGIERPSLCTVWSPFLQSICDLLCVVVVSVNCI